MDKPQGFVGDQQPSKSLFDGLSAPPVLEGRPFCEGACYMATGIHGQDPRNIFLFNGQLCLQGADALGKKVQKVVQARTPLAGGDGQKLLDRVNDLPGRHYVFF